MATMSHELRTPLNAIIGFSELLLEEVYGLLNRDQIEFLNDIKNSSNHLLEMINRILDISKIESGKSRIIIEKINVANLLTECLSIFKPVLNSKKLKFRKKGINKKTYIHADRMKLKQIINNLLSNAFKFTEKGRVIFEFLDEKENWFFKVEDTGIGIAERDFDVIFKDFKRVDSPFVKKIPGTGLGLALTKRLVELHGGNISFSSKIGYGTIFTFSIPKENIGELTSIADLLRVL